MVASDLSCKEEESRNGCFKIGVINNMANDCRLADTRSTIQPEDRFIRGIDPFLDLTLHVIPTARLIFPYKFRHASFRQCAERLQISNDLRTHQLDSESESDTMIRMVLHLLGTAQLPAAFVTRIFEDRSGSWMLRRNGETCCAVLAFGDCQTFSADHCKTHLVRRS